jgi:hypothetical protein
MSDSKLGLLDPQFNGLSMRYRLPELHTVIYFPHKINRDYKKTCSFAFLLVENITSARVGPKWVRHTVEKSKLERSGSFWCFSIFNPL